FSTVSIWRRKDNLQMEPLVSTQTEGSYSMPKDYPGQLTSPKVLFSPRGNFVASLDMEGCLSTFQFDEGKCSFSKLSDVKSCNSEATIDISSTGTGFLHDIVDFTWWSDEILTVAKRNGNIIMVDILNEVNISENDLAYSLPLLESAQQSPGLVFSSREYFRYQAALGFADRHGFDKDEVLKSQWLSSSQGVHEINTILPAIKDLGFILSECVDKVGSTEDAVRTLLSFGLRVTDSYRFSDAEDNNNGQIWNFRLARLKLLQYRDRLETFLGINMGRFSVQEYGRFRDLPVSKAAMLLAESGKIGALNLLFKRHPYSLIPSMLEVLAAIPETIPVQSYGQLLPAISAPSNIVLRDEDWVECDKMVKFIKDVHQNHESNIQFMTEPIIMKHMAFQWPSVSELSSWYKKRARDIDTLSGQLDNCMCLVDLAIHKGISELKQFLEDIFYLHQLIYSDENVDEISFSMSLDTWEQLPDYEKFKLIMMGAIEENVIPRLHKKAIPFMQSRFHTLTGVHAAVDYLTRDNTVDSFLVRWLKELASQNKLDMCLIIIEEGCRDMANHHFFKDEVELVDCALQCVYLCNDLDRWSTMSTILSKLPQMREIEAKDIKHRLKLAEGHVEAGRLLTYYQVPKPISFFLDAHADEKGKTNSSSSAFKFIRWQPARTDHDWANMWRDLQSLQEKAFAFLDLEYMLIEFCRGLLKAGKFSLARNYLKGTSSVALATDKAENLQKCQVEADIIDAITVRLPSLGVNLLPMAFRQIKDPMEIIKLAITSQSGAYLNVEELIEIAKLLGLSSQEDISTVQEAIAREAAYAGDVQLAFDLCLVLAKKGHGSVWDLCAALARSQALENMHSKSQKLLLGFALSHCDEESLPAEFSEQNSSNPGEFSGRIGFNSEDQEPQVTKAKSLLSLVAQNLASVNGYDWGTLLNENGKVVSFAASQLPWLLKLSEDADFGKRLTSGSVSRIQHVSIRTRAVMTILSWLTRSSFTPRDDLIASLAKSIMEPPVSDGEDILGCSVLLNLVDAFHGAEIIEEQLKITENYREFSSLMNMGMLYSLLHSYGIECKNPAQRRELLLSKFQEKHKTQSSDKCTDVPEAQSTFWNDWKVKLEQQKHVADKSRVLENLIPGVETSRFLSGDMEYIESVIFSLIESVKMEKKQILNDALILAHTYGLDRSKVLLYYLNTILVSEDLNFGCFNNEVCTQINEKNVEALAKMVQNLVLIYGDTAPEGLLSWKYVYTHFVSSSLDTLEGKIETETHFQSSEEVYSFISEIEQKYDVCKNYIRFMESPGVLDTVLRFFTIILCINKRLRTFPCDSSGKECLVKLINFWLRLMNDMEELVSLDISGERFYSEYSMTCLKVLLDLLVKGIVSPNQGWCALINYVTYGLKCGVAIETFNFCRAMIFCGCGFEAIACVFSEIVAQLPAGSLLITTIENTSFSIQDLPNLYLSILETILQELDSGSLGRQSLHRLLSSLSKLEGDLEDLKKVRSSVWERMSMFSGNLQLPSHLRVYALELMQFISGRRKNLDGFSSEGLADLLPWEGWDDLKNTIANQDMSEDSTAEDVSSRFTSTLVALKSSQLVSSISPSLEITPEDIVSVDSAVSSFLRVSEAATTASHVGALLAGGVEGLFTTGKDENAPVEVSDAVNNSWSNDDWDEDFFLALKIALLLPYEAIQLQCLDAVEKKLKEGGIPDNIAQDHFMFVLVLSSGILSSIISKASYGSTFSCLCFMVGNFSRRFQEAQASTTKHVAATGGEKNKENLDFLFAKLLFPCFITALVKADQHILAGFLVTRFMHKCFT
ncbi:UNVERIFIED_CONTAM: MAG2-interacting protein 2, partial [Sesamum radiatum]